MTSHTQAALLGVGGNDTNWPGIPNLYSQTLSISYNATTHQFTASGSTSDYFDLQTNDNLVVSDPTFDDTGTFSLSATVATNGTLVSGTVSLGSAGGVYGAPDYTSQIYPAGTLLQGNLTAFGFEGASVNNRSQFDFEFNVTGGSLASVYGPVAGTVMYTEDYSFGGSFTTSFNNGGQGDADTLMMVPEPEPQLLVIMSVLGLCWVARWRASLRKG